MNEINKIFEMKNIDEESLYQTSQIAPPTTRFIIAITPRSGSSLLCDVLKNTNLFGRPDELLSQEFLPEILTKIPGRNPDEYLQNALKRLKSKNGASGIKASWFQFKAFADSMKDSSSLLNFKYIYLARHDLFSQAVSLYKATSTTVFHTNIKHSQAALNKLENLDYNYKIINYWYRHIRAQETGWKQYFEDNKISPLCISYEEIADDIVAVVKHIAEFIGVEDKAAKSCSSSSIFKKVGDESNVQWAQRFSFEFAKNNS